MADSDESLGTETWGGIWPDSLEPEKAGGPECETCRRIQGIIQGDEKLRFIGYRKQLLQCQCQFHDPILHYLLHDDKTYQQSHSVGDEEAFDDMVYAHGGLGDTSLRIFLSIGTGCRDLGYFQLVQNASKNTVQGSGIFINALWIDTSLFCKWKEHCTKHHQKCHQTAAIQGLFTRRPVLLIDTWRMCLVDAPPEASYVALSYVWGVVSTYRTVKQNLANMREDQALAQLLQNCEIPRTIAHAIQVTKLLKERYLWVDTLCIVQDDDGSKHQQINAMASIYFNSSLTIIAAEGSDVHHGITGLRGISSPRSCSQRVFDLYGNNQLIELPFPYLAHQKWSRRGWTFQEHLFSHRRLIFGDHRVRWECKEDGWQEDIIHNISPRAAPDPFGQVELQSENLCWPNLSYYMEVISHYNERDFTYAKDAHFALAGFLALISGSYEGGFLYGLPEMCFDDAMLWQPAQTLQRRVPGLPPPSDFQLPSWSWMGWHGSIDRRSCLSANEFVKIHYSAFPDYTTTGRTISTVKWYYVSTATTNVKRPILVTCKKYSQLSMNIGQALPLGWTEHKYDWNNMNDEAKDFWRDKQFVQQIYKYEGAPHREFWYPFPMPSNRPLQEFQPVPGSYLFCKTRKASFFAVRCEESSRSGASLRDENGGWVGYVRFNDERELETIPSRRNTWATSVCFDLVAISAGYVRNDCDDTWLEEFEVSERPKDSEFYEFVNVLWVTWDQGIAQRRGLGRVIKSAWEAEEREEIDLKLG